MVEDCELSSACSSDSDSPKFVFHRRLHLRNLSGFNPSASGIHSGIEVFTSNLCKLDKAALKAAGDG